MSSSEPLPPQADANAARFSASEDDVFSRIATRYDSLCDLFSVGAHRVWKSRMARRIAREPWGNLLDVASGTGDIPLRVIRHLDAERGRGAAAKIVMSDLCPAMLDVAKAKPRADDPRLEYAILDAHDLAAVPSASVDVYSISFGMKIMDRERVMSEASRVLRPGGRFFCLEAGQIPVRPVQAAYLRYMDWCVPVIAKMATGGDAGAYNYLLKGIHEFPAQRDFARELEEHGFRDVRYENLTLGIAAMHEATRR